MKKLSFYAVVTVFIFSAFLLISCGELEKNETDDEQNDGILTDESEIPDETVVDEEEVVDDAPAELAYPEDVSATCKEAGNVARNLAFFDEKNVEHTLAEWYKLNNESSKLIWLIFSTYDCPACKDEKKDISTLNGKYEKEGLRTILIMNGYLSGPKPTEEPAKVAEQKETMIMMEGSAANHTYGYLGWEHQAEFKNFTSNSYPLNIFIDASSMSIVKYFPGWDDEDVVLNEMDTFIDSILDIL